MVLSFNCMLNPSIKWGETTPKTSIGPLLLMSTHKGKEEIPLSRLSDAEALINTNDDFKNLRPVVQELHASGIDPKKALVSVFPKGADLKPLLEGLDRIARADGIQPLFDSYHLVEQDEISPKSVLETHQELERSQNFFLNCGKDINGICLPSDADDSPMYPVERLGYGAMVTNIDLEAINPTEVKIDSDTSFKITKDRQDGMRLNIFLTKKEIIGDHPYEVTGSIGVLDASERYKPNSLRTPVRESFDFINQVNRELEQAENTQEAGSSN